MSLDVAHTIAAAIRGFVLRWRSAKRAMIWPTVRWEHLLFVAGAGALLLLADEPLARAADQASRQAVAVARLVTDFGLSFYMLAIAGAVTLSGILGRHRGAGRRVDAGMALIAERATYIFVSVSVAGILAQIAKHVIGRARPRFLDTLGAYHFQFLDFHASRNSFPSGHAANAFAAATALALLWPRGRHWLWLAACLIGVSRVLVHAHYLSDVAFGALLGIGSAYGAALMFAARGMALRQRGTVLVTRGRRSVAALFRGLGDRLRRRPVARRS